MPRLLRRALAAAVALSIAALLPTWSAQAEPARAAGSTRQRLYVTNSAGNDVHVVDMTTLEVIKRVEVGPQPHGIAAPRDARVIFVAIEAMKQPAGELVWYDPQTDAVTRRLTIGPEPNQLACTPDGKIAYVPCKDGYYWVIDTDKAEVITKVFTGGRPHNTLSSVDGRHMYLSPMGNPKKVIITETATHKIVGEVPFSNVTRPIALADDQKRVYAQVDGLIGFEVGDIPGRRMIHRVESAIPEALKSKASRSHGLALSPNQKEVWSCDSFHALVAVFDVTVEPPRQVASIATDGPVYWLHFTPDGKYCIVSERETNQVAIVDAATRKIVKHIPVGKVPKRTLVLDVPLRSNTGAN
jgi:YVTN family beta-propeller protein